MWGILACEHGLLPNSTRLTTNFSVLRIISFYLVTIRQLKSFLSMGIWSEFWWLDVSSCNVMDTIFWLSPSIESCNWIDFISVAYASWYHWNLWPVAEHSARLQPSINLHAPVTAFMFSCSGTVPNVLPRRDEGSGMPCAVIEAS